mmetsp:Transcript_14316/g.28520  ORF Transcript_14316/g.28520 Transcript_14316/m.28520 type:complete len:206 (-) Transcript_14316:27-644(-)
MEPGRDDRLLPDNISFCKFVHRPMASGSCLSLFPVKMSHRSWGCRASGSISSIWFSLNDTIVRFSNSPRTAGYFVNLFLKKKRILRAGSEEASEEGRLFSSRPQFGKSSLVIVDRVLVNVPLVGDRKRVNIALCVLLSMLSSCVSFSPSLGMWQDFLPASWGELESSNSSSFCGVERALSWSPLDARWGDWGERSGFIFSNFQVV